MNELLKRLDLIGEKLGEGVGFVWEISLMQAFWVNGVFTVIFSVSLALVAYGAYRLTRHLHERSTDDDCSDEFPYLLGMLGTGIGFIVAVVGSTANLYAGIVHMINPQYYALMDLAKMLGK